MARRVTNVTTVTTTSAITTENSTPIFVGRAKTIGIQCVIDVNTPGAKSFATSDVNTTTDLITEATHGYVTGLKGQFTTTGTLPAGLSLATDYFVVAATASTYGAATSLVNAQAGTKVDLTDVGSGTHTFTPTSLAGATVTLQKSNDYDPEVSSSGTWDAVEAATAITADGDVWISDIDPEYLYMRLSYTLTAGSLSASSTIAIKEDF